LSNTWRTGGGIELHADSAPNPVLSSNVWRLHSSWSVAHDVTHWLTLTFTTDYNYSIAEEHDALRDARTGSHSINGSRPE
jgi:hypothetical protein